MSIIFLSFHAEKTGISLSSGREACSAILGGTFSVLVKQCLKCRCNLAPTCTKLC